MDIESRDYGKSKTALYSLANMASYAQMSQDRVSSQISNGLQCEVKVLSKQSKRNWAYLPKDKKFLKTMESFSFGKIWEPILPILISKMVILGVKIPIIGI